MTLARGAPLWASVSSPVTGHSDTWPTGVISRAWKAFTPRWLVTATPYPPQLLPKVALSFSESEGSSGPPARPFLYSLRPLQGEHFTASPWLKLLGAGGRGGGGSAQEERTRQTRVPPRWCHSERLASLEPSPHPGLHAVCGSAPRGTLDRWVPALCSESRCLQSPTGSCEPLPRVKDSGRWQTGRDMFACWPSGEPLGLPGNQETRAAGLPPASWAAGPITEMRPFYPTAPGVRTSPIRDMWWSWPDSQAAAQSM